MEKFTVGSVVLVTFPFSNLKGKKVRPALVLANVEFDNLILCQITSRPYSSQTSIRIDPSDFIEGSLPVVSFVRPDKLFTAESSILNANPSGKLNQKVTKLVLQKVQDLFKE